MSGLVALGLSESPSTPALESFLASSAQAVSGTGNGYGIPKADGMLKTLMKSGESSTSDADF